MSGACVGQDSAGPACQDGRDPLAVAAQPAMPEREYALVQPYEVPASDPILDQT